VLGNADATAGGAITVANGALGQVQAGLPKAVTVSTLATNGLLLTCLWTGGRAAGPHEDTHIRLDGIT